MTFKDTDKFDALFQRVLEFSRSENPERGIELCSRLLRGEDENYMIDSDGDRFGAATTLEPFWSPVTALRVPRVSSRAGVPRGGYGTVSCDLPPRPRV